MDYGRLEGLIPLLSEIYGYLIYYRVVPSKNCEGWKRRYGGLMKIALPICVLFGILLLAGVVG